MQLHLKEFLDRLNVGNAVLYVLLLLFAVLLSLRVEGVIGWSYGAVFFPLWLWNALVLAGAVSGVVVSAWKKRLRRDAEDLCSLILSAAILQPPVFLTELLVAVNLDSGAHQWRAILTPLYILPLFSLLPCIWGCFKKKSLDLELLGIFSLLQVIFIGIRLDRVVVWKWALVFIPTYLLLLVYFIFVLVYSLNLLHHHLYPSQTDSPQELQTNKMADILRVICSVGVGLCFTVFMALLASQLDGTITSSYPAIFTPLYLTLLLLLLSTITRQPANPLWFGLNRTFSTFLLDTCPVLREYVNISVVPEDSTSQNSVIENEPHVKSKARHKLRETSLTIASDMYPLEEIFSPD